MNARKVATIAALTIGLGLGLVACSSTTDKPAGHVSTAPGVSKGLGARDATADVVIGPLTPSTSEFDSPSASVKVTNHSSKRSMYLITVALESANHATQFGTTTVLIQSLEPGQSTLESAEFYDHGGSSAASVPVVKEVQRTAAS